ncbi:MAG: DUF697 domain-containing protein [Planctomycetia bacterium]|nr:DUF697 domain-containing protein [Planctomycetia bacterium]
MEVWKKTKENVKKWLSEQGAGKKEEGMDIPDESAVYVPPVLWLFGKAQAGKTSIIHALTKDSRAEVGSGFKPCTRFSRQYAYGGEGNPILYFLDTRGLGEKEYDPREDIKAHQSLAHGVLVVVKAMDQALECLAEPLRIIKAQYPGWRFLVIQTALHEGYPPEFRDHILPYPYENPEDEKIPENLRRSLAAQREYFHFLDPIFVPVDFTLEEDGFSDVNYGLDSLWRIIDEYFLPGLQNAISVVEDMDLLRSAAKHHVLAYSLAAGSVAAVPVPFVAAPAILAIQAKMFHYVASVYGQPMNRKRMVELAGMFGASYFSRMAAKELLKFIPVVGTAASMAAVAGTTYALGYTLCVYFTQKEKGEKMEMDSLREIYSRQMEKGRQLLQKYLEEIQKK